MEPKKVILEPTVPTGLNGNGFLDNGQPFHPSNYHLQGDKLSAAEWADAVNSIAPYLNAPGLKCGLSILDESLANLKKLDALNDPSNQDNDELSVFWRQQLKAKQQLLLQQLLQLPSQYFNPTPTPAPKADLQITPPEDLKKIMSKILDKGTVSRGSGEVLESCFKELQGTCARLSDGLKAQPIGSTAIGFHTCFSDFDVCVLQKQTEGILDEWTMAHGFLQLLLTFLQSNPRFKTMGTILSSWSEDAPVATLRFQNWLTVKVCFNSAAPIQHMMLLRQYAMLDQKVRKLVVLVKLWGKFQGELPSYPLTLMVLYYMQLHPRVQLPVLSATSSEVVPSSSWTCNVPIEELLCGFFYFYGMRYCWGSEVVSVRRGKRSSINDECYSALRQTAGCSLMCIEDPCNLSKKLSCVEGGDSQEQMFQALFKEIADVLMAGQVPQSFYKVLTSLKSTEGISIAPSSGSSSGGQSAIMYATQASSGSLPSYGSSSMDPMFISTQAGVPDPMQQSPFAALRVQAQQAANAAVAADAAAKANAGARFPVASPGGTQRSQASGSSVGGETPSTAKGGSAGGAREDGKRKKNLKKQTLASSMQVLEHEDPDTVLIVRRINKLGFKAEQALTKHFSTNFGPVKRVLLAHATSRQNRAVLTKLRPSNLGFVQMKSAELASKIFEHGETQDVDGCPILVQRFARRLEGEEDGQEELPEVDDEASPAGGCSFSPTMRMEKDGGSAKSSNSSTGNQRTTTPGANESNETVSSSFVDSGGDSKSQSSDKSDKSSE